MMMKYRRWRRFKMTDVTEDTNVHIKNEKFRKTAYIWSDLKNDDPADHTVDLTFVDRYERNFDLTLSAKEARDMADMLIRCAAEVEAAQG